MSSHDVQIYHREFDPVTGARNYCAACEPCNWLGPWRTKCTRAKYDGERHARLEARHKRIIKRDGSGVGDGRFFEVSVYDGALWLSDWCQSCEKSLQGTAVGFRGDNERVLKKLERAIDARMRRPLEKRYDTVCRCGLAQSDFDADAVMAELCGVTHPLSLLNAEWASAAQPSR